jgi:hypothetical protein
VKKSEILKEAKKILWNGYDPYEDELSSKKQRFICNAVTDVKGADKEQKLEIKQWITRLLEGYHNYETWLRQHAYIDVYITENQHIIAQKSRHQWIDWMITYWEAKGE